MLQRKNNLKLVENEKVSYFSVLAVKCRHALQMVANSSEAKEILE
jgi:hypothetical protein